MTIKERMQRIREHLQQEKSERGPISIQDVSCRRELNWGDFSDWNNSPVFMAERQKHESL